MRGSLPIRSTALGHWIAGSSERSLRRRLSLAIRLISCKVDVARLASELRGLSCTSNSPSRTAWPSVTKILLTTPPSVCCTDLRLPKVVTEPSTEAPSSMGALTLHTAKAMKNSNTPQFMTEPRRMDSDTGGVRSRLVRSCGR